MGTPSKSSRMVKSHPRGVSMACQRPRVNSQWSVWYCVIALALQVYIIATSIQRFTRYVSLPWPPQGQPYLELNAYVAFMGAAVVLLPFFLLSALMKVGNYANDGHKLGDEEPDMVVYQNLRRRKCFRWVKAAWKHGGPIAPLIHMAAAMCLLLPRLLVEAQLIKHGFLSKERPSLLEPKKVERIQEFYIETIKSYIDSHRPPGKNYFARLLSTLTELRTLGNMNSELCFSLKVQNKRLPAFLEEIWDIQE